MSATARDLLAMKNSAVVYTCAPDDTVAEACRVLRERRVGCLVVVRGAQVQGLLSEREVAHEVVGRGLDPAAVRVAEVMRRQVPAVALDAPCEEVEAALHAAGARHATVVGARGLLGVVSLGDLARFLAGRERAAAAAPALH